MKTITEQTDPITGNLRADPAAKSLLRSLQALVSKPLVGGAIAGLPRSLSEIGVATNTDGTLRVDSALLAKQLAANPDTIEAMFAPSGTNALGLSATLTALTTSATSTVTGLGASTVRYTAAEADVAKQQDKVTDQSAQLTTRLTQQYASMNSRVSAYKSTQTFLTNQIAAWNKDS
ncbi:flagellar filament capping protein FliD [Sphingomonas sp. 22L2VL55-3]